MKKRAVLLLALRRALRVVLTLFLLCTARADGLALLVPAYFEPNSGRWGKLASAASRVPLVAIANVENGPGYDKAPHADYSAALQSVRAAGGQVIGYVYTQYGRRPIEMVKADMLRWHQLYPLDGFFVDEMANAAATSLLDYYAELQRYARELNPAYRIMGNPGTNTDEAYLSRPTSDVLVIFENDSGYPSFVPAAWINKYPEPQFGHLTYAVAGAEQMTNFVQLAEQRHAGFIYVTDDNGSNPWDTLPSYWEAEVSMIEGLNRAAAERVRSKLSLALESSATLRLRAQGATGRYVLEAASPLGDWKPLATNLTNTGTSVWHVLNLFPNRFFRLKQDQ